VGRSARLSVGAIAAAVAAGQVAPNHLAAAVALGLAAALLLAESRPRLGARSLVPVLAGAGLIVLRLAVVPAGQAALDVPPTGDGPWTLIVAATGSPRDGQQVATLRTPPDAAVPFTVAATLPRYPVVIPGDRIVVDGTVLPRPDSAYGSYLERIGAAGTLRSRTIRVEPVPDDLGRRLEALRRGAAEALARVLPEPEADSPQGSSSACAMRSIETSPRPSRPPVSAMSWRSRAGISRSSQPPSRLSPAEWAGAVAR